LIMSRPRVTDPLQRIRELKRESIYKPTDPEFGY